MRGIEKDGCGTEGSHQEHEIFRADGHAHVQESQDGDAQGGLKERDEAVPE
jgi:hypothetical protein